MSNITCYDVSGRLLKKLYQWDVNQTITVKGLDTSMPYEFHFCHQCDDKALVVAPDIYDDCFLVRVPNLLLVFSMPIIMFVCLNDGSSSRTVHKVHIPVDPRPEPDEYEFTEDIDGIRIKWEALHDEAKALISELETAIDDIPPFYVIPYYKQEDLLESHISEINSIVQSINAETRDYVVFIKDGSRTIPACHIKDRHNTFVAVLHETPPQEYKIVVTNTGSVTTNKKPYVAEFLDDTNAPTGWEIPSTRAVIAWVEEYVQAAIGASSETDV